MTLTEFLLARIADDMAAYPGPRRVAVRERMLAECEAKRRIVELHAEMVSVALGREDRLTGECAQCVAHHTEDADCANETYPCPTLRLLAQPYADHSDYDEAWRPV